jgi:quinol-cytochrome oxidoreductase complex cytochrome b subunit
MRSISMSEAELTTKEEETVPFYPDHVKIEFYVVVGITILAIIVGALGLLIPVGLEEPADPMNTPAHVKPEWYFLALYQLLRFIPKTTGAVLPVIAVIVLVLWPFFDRKPDKSKKTYRIRFVVVAIGMIIFIAFTIWGQVS